MKKKQSGKVILVGAGPGDLGLLTVRGASLLAQADAVIYDSLLHPRILDLVKPSAEKIFAGSKAQTRSRQRQQTIQKLFLDCASKYSLTVRLKGGDPFVFGRGGEEAEFLARKKILFEIVPGVSAGHAVPAYAGIPVTDRRFASQVTFLTANEDPEKPNQQILWDQIAKLSGTLVLFMGVKSLGKVTRALIQAGKSKQTLVQVIEWGTLPFQKTAEGTLATIAAKVKQANLSSPAITVMGEVNQFRKKIAWFENRPLYGKKVLVTRARTQAGTLSRELENLGAEVLEFPVIDIAPPEDWNELDQAISNLHYYDWIVFTSVNAVEPFFSRLFAGNKDIRALGKLKIASIGSMTQNALLQKGIRADLIPDIFTSEAMLSKLQETGELEGKRILLPRTDIAPEALSRGLRDSGAHVTQVVAYRTLNPLNASKKKALLAALTGPKPVDLVTLTSASTAHHLLGWIPKPKIKNLKSKFVTVGPVTTAALKSYGLKPFKEAKEHTISGLVETLLHS